MRFSDEGWCVQFWTEDFFPVMGMGLLAVLSGVDGSILRYPIRGTVRFSDIGFGVHLCMPVVLFKYAPSV